MDDKALTLKDELGWDLRDFDDEVQVPFEDLEDYLERGSGDLVEMATDRARELGHDIRHEIRRFRDAEDVLIDYLVEYGIPEATYAEITLAVETHEEKLTRRMKDDAGAEGRRPLGAAPKRNVRSDLHRRSRSGRGPDAV